MNAAEKPMQVEGGEVNIEDLPKLPQRQDSLTAQLRDLCAVANRLGMYDAADYLRQGLASMSETEALVKTQAELLGLLNQWISRFREVESAYKAGRDLLGCGPDSQLMCALYGAFGDYTKMLARVICDDDEWLEWYLWENGAGEKGLEAKAAHQERMVPIKTIEDLCGLILKASERQS